MGLTYFKRFRMEIDLTGLDLSPSPLPSPYRILPWSSDRLRAHAEAKYYSFRSEIDSSVFPCLGELEGCVRLMDEISKKEGFLPEATWLLEYLSGRSDRPEYCGTVQGIRADGAYGGIQNLGVTPCHRGQRLGTRLMEHALSGFRSVGLSRAYLEVTARNQAAVQLYQHIGFSRTRTLYKAVEVACT